MEEQKKVRCAIYTRKSTDEGLDKEFNTLEAQREAGANYILSQKHQGWIACPIGGGSPWAKDASKADVSLNLYARKLALRYLEDNDECFVYLSSCIGKSELPSAEVKTIKEGKIQTTTLSITQIPSEIISELGLNQPIFAKLCRNGLVYRTGPSCD